MGPITIGSLFSGIGGFELGLERAIPNSKTVWQVEQNKYCQGILKKHWPEATIHKDIKEVSHANVHPTTIICGGFPCQDISVAGKGAGIENGEKSSLWGEMYRLIDELRPRVAVMENVPALLWKGRGMHVVMSNLAKIGYDAEWTVISAKQFGAPHLRKRVFIIAYPHSRQPRQNQPVQTRGLPIDASYQYNDTRPEITNTNSKHSEQQPIYTRSMETKSRFKRRCSEVSRIQQTEYKNYWQDFPTQPPLRHRNDGVSNRLARLRALGNAIVPQCSEYIGHCIVQSGLLDDLLYPNTQTPKQQ